MRSGPPEFIRLENERAQPNPSSALNACRHGLRVPAGESQPIGTPGYVMCPGFLALLTCTAKASPDPVRNNINVSMEPPFAVLNLCCLAKPDDPMAW